MMVSTLVRLAAALSLLAPSFAQDRFFFENPEEEKTALSNIVEDEAPPPSGRKGKWLSPEYTLIYRNPLPIPQVKQPKQ